MKRFYRLHGPQGQTSPVFKTHRRCWLYLFGRISTRYEQRQYRLAGWIIVTVEDDK